MKKILLAAVVVGLFLVSLKLVPTFASGGVERPQTDREDATAEFTADMDQDQPAEKEPVSVDKLRPTEKHLESLNDLAGELGVSIEGKDQEALVEEVRSEIIKQRAAEAGISVEGKDEAAIMEEIQNLYEGEIEAKGSSEESSPVTKEDARNLIERKPVDTGGKSLEEFKQEKQDDLMKKAQEFGISTDGKSFEEIVTELKKVRPER